MNEGILRMAGHNKWSKIKRSKGLKDAQFAKVASKVCLQITAASRSCKGDRDNPTLSSLISKAKAAHLTKDTIEKAIKKGVDGGNTGEMSTTVTYEGMGPAGVAVIVETLTNNKTRTVGVIRHIFSKYGGSVGTTGAVQWIFDRKGAVTLDVDPDTAFEIALEAGGDDVEPAEDNPGQSVIVCPVEAIGPVATYAAERGHTVAGRALFYQAKDTFVELDGEKSESFESFLEELEDNPDVSDVYHNAIDRSQDSEA